MPRRVTLTPAVERLLDAQDLLLSRKQALAGGFTSRSIDRQLARRQWQVVLPSVYLTHPGRVSRRHQLIASVLYVGVDSSAIDGITAATESHDLRAIRTDSRVFVVTHGESPARSREFVVVRRANRPPPMFVRDDIPIVGAATAVVGATRRMRNERDVLAAFSELVQRRKASYEALCDFRQIAEAHPDLPPLVYNCLLRLPGGRLISPDALAIDAGLVHETNGRRPHAREDLFEDMQERHDVMTVAGLTVLHNSPRRIGASPRIVIEEFAQCYRRLAGRGLPPGVEVVKLAA